MTLASWSVLGVLVVRHHVIKGSVRLNEVVLT